MKALQLDFVAKKGAGIGTELKLFSKGELMDS